ncbi:RDD family protein [Flavobacterium aureirubrum]|uniref:RDD family protein n=1 Tax=Flavobacterium aureirubrum TaxID=3133147 RepID=UPI003183D8F8
MESLFLKKRVYALIIDILLISLSASMFLTIIDLNSIKIGNIDFLNRKWVVGYNVNFFITLLYFFIFDFISNGSSLGKRFVGLKIEKNQSTPKLQVRVLRSSLKSFLLFSIFIPVTLVFYFFKNEVLYDNILKTDVTLS